MSRGELRDNFMRTSYKVRRYRLDRMLFMIPAVVVAVSLGRYRSWRQWRAPAMVGILLVELLMPHLALAQAQGVPPAPSDTEPLEPGAATGFWTRSTLLGDLGGARSALDDYGITIGLQETSEVLGNITGGTRKGFAYDGLTQLRLGIDLGKKLGLDGGALTVSALQIHGRNLSTDNLQTLQTASGIEASRTTRLWELWYQQSAPDPRFDIKLGQQAIDQEFIGSDGSSLFINTMMGWPMVPSVDLYAGGPAYPLSSLGIRLRGQQLGQFAVQVGVFDDNPPGGTFLDASQLRGAERSGTRFNLGTGALFIAEVQYALNQPANGKMNVSDQTTGFPGLYKLGVWYDTASFLDPRVDSAGILLASPLSNGEPRMHRHNYSVYGVFDQVIWRPEEGQSRTVAVFARIMGAPADRNLVSFSVNAGVTVKAPFPDRNDDTFGIGWGIAKVSANASGFDTDQNRFGLYTPVRGTENFLELTYQYQAAGWWQIQPDFQYVFMPGAGIANPRNPGKRIENEAVLGVRTLVSF